MISFVKRIFGRSAFYKSVRSLYYSYLREVPRRRLRRHGYKAIRIVLKSLEGTEASVFVDFGTMLGAVREHEFIRHDDDIDFSVVAGSISPLRLLELFDGKNGFVFSHAFEFRNQITEMTFLYCGIEVDFFFSYLRSDRMFTMAYRPGDPYDRSVGARWMAYAIERTNVSDMITAKIANIDVPVPNNFDVLLTECYGQWKAPVVGWSGDKDYGQRQRINYNEYGTVVDIHRIREIGSHSHLNFEC